MIWKRLACSRSRDGGALARSRSRCSALPPWRSTMSATSASPWLDPRPGRQAPRVLGRCGAASPAASPPRCRAPRPPPSPTPPRRRGWPSDPPSGMASTALWIRRTRASRSSKALPSTGGSASMSWVTVMTVPLPLRLVAPARRGQLERLGDHRGQADRPEGDLGLAGDELLELPNGGGRLEGHVADHHEPAARARPVALAQHQLGIGEDGGERVVEVVGEAADRLAERRGDRRRGRAPRAPPRGAGRGRAPSSASSRTERSISIFVRAIWRAMSWISS